MAICIKHRKELNSKIFKGLEICEDCLEDAALESVANFGDPETVFWKKEEDDE